MHGHHRHRLLSLNELLAEHVLVSVAHANFFTLAGIGSQHSERLIDSVPMALDPEAEPRRLDQLQSALAILLHRPELLPRHRVFDHMWRIKQLILVQTALIVVPLILIHGHRYGCS